MAEESNRYERKPPQRYPDDKRRVTRRETLFSKTNIELLNPISLEYCNFTIWFVTCLRIGFGMAPLALLKIRFSIRYGALEERSLGNITVRATSTIAPVDATQFPRPSTSDGQKYCGLKVLPLLYITARLRNSTSSTTPYACLLC